MAEQSNNTFIEPIINKKVYIPGNDPDNHDSDIELFVAKRQESIAKPASPRVAAPKKRAAARKRAAPAPKIDSPEPSPRQEEAKPEPVTPVPRIFTPAPIESETEYDSSSSSYSESTPRNIYRGRNRSVSPSPRKTMPKPAVVQETPVEKKPTIVNSMVGVETMDRETLITKITLYRQLFNDKFSKSLQTKIARVETSCNIKTPQLRQIFEECRLSCGKNTMTNLALPIFCYGLDAYEYIVGLLGVQSKDLARFIKTRPELKGLLDEIMIEYINIGYIPAHYRLMMMIVMSTSTVHFANLNGGLRFMDDTTQQQSKQETKQETKQEATQQTKQETKPQFVAVLADNNVPDVDSLSFNIDKEKYKHL